MGNQVKPARFLLAGIGYGQLHCIGHALLPSDPHRNFGEGLDTGSYNYIKGCTWVREFGYMVPNILEGCFEVQVSRYVLRYILGGVYILKYVLRYMLRYKFWGMFWGVCVCVHFKVSFEVQVLRYILRYVLRYISRYKFQGYISWGTSFWGTFFEVQVLRYILRYKFWGTFCSTQWPQI